MEISDHTQRESRPVTNNNNRPKITLYGVQLEEIYAVQVTSLPMRLSSTLLIIGQKLMLQICLYNSITTVPIDLLNQMNSNNTVTVVAVETPNTPVFIIKGYVNNREKVPVHVKLNLLLSPFQSKRANGNW